MKGRVMVGTNLLLCFGADCAAPPNPRRHSGGIRQQSFGQENRCWRQTPRHSARKHHGEPL